MIAFESRNTANRIDHATVLSIRYGDDTPGFYAVPTEQVANLVTSADNLGATVEVVSRADALNKFHAGAWIGIRLCSVHGIAAWGRAILEG